MIKKITYPILILIIITLSLLLYYEKEDKRYISKVTEKDNISMLKIVGEDTEVIKQVPQTGQWVMSYTCDDENAKLYWNEKKRTVVAKNISATECTLIFRESDAIFRMISMYVDGEYVTELDSTKKYEMESYECTNGEELTWNLKNSRISIEPISKDTSCYVNFNEINFIPLKDKILKDNNEQSDINIDFAYNSGGCSESTYNSSTKEYECSSYNANQVTNGLYYTADETVATYGEDGEKIYYFRGDVDNNWVSFAGYKWRIVRTTSEGGVKLVYSGDGLSDSSAIIAAAPSFMPAYVESGNDTDAKKVMDAWYTGTKYSARIDFSNLDTKLLDYSNYLSETAIFCNDNTYREEYIYEDIADGNVSYKYYGAYDRLVINKRPSFACPETNASRYTVSTSTGNGYLTYPVALLSADEMYYSGISQNGNPVVSPYIIENLGESYWTMTFSAARTGFGFARVFILTNTVLDDNFDINSDSYLRPSVSLKSCVTVVGNGNGEFDTPYELSDIFC